VLNLLISSVSERTILWIGVYCEPVAIRYTWLSLSKEFGGEP